jgi:hypothetical protein
MKLSQIITLLKEGRIQQGLSLLHQRIAKGPDLDSTLALSEIYFVQEACQDGIKHLQLADDEIESHKGEEQLQRHTLLRYLKLKKFIGDKFLTNGILSQLHALGEDLPLWADDFFSINNPGRGAQLLEFDDFFYLPIPKTASSTLASHWCKTTKNIQTINPFPYYLNPYFKTCSVPQNRGRSSPSKPIIVITRDESARLESYYHTNIIKHNSLSQGKGATLLGLSARPQYEEFKKKLELYKLVFNDTAHHLLPCSAYTRPYQANGLVTIDIAHIAILERLFTKTFPAGFFQRRRLMARHTN